MSDQNVTLSKDTLSTPHKITAIWLRNHGGAVIVAVEVDGHWIEVIRESDGSNYSHIVERAGINDAILRTMARRS